MIREGRKSGGCDDVSLIYLISENEVEWRIAACMQLDQHDQLVRDQGINPKRFGDLPVSDLCAISTKSPTSSPCASNLELCFQAPVGLELQRH